MGRHGPSEPAPEPRPPAAPQPLPLPGHGHPHSHAHGHTTAPAIRPPRHLVAVLGALVGLILAATAVGAILLWPPPVQPPPTVGNPYAGVTFLPGTVQSVTRTTCDGTTADRLPDGTVPTITRCATAEVRIDGGLDGAGAREVAGTTVSVAVPFPIARAGLETGDRVRLVRFPAADGNPAVIAWSDLARARPLTALAVAFALLVVLVARLKGLAALAGLGLAYAAIWLFVIPALLAGRDPVLVALVAASAIMTALLYLAHGLTVKTTTALLGTLVGLLATAGVARWATAATGLTGLYDESGDALSRLTTGAGIGDVVLCGVIIAGLGVLNDVTISQASAVWELHAVAPGLGARRLFLGGMRIGRDHLASVVYTIAFVYAGAALPTLMLQQLYQQPIGDIVVGGTVAEELVRTLVTSSSLVLTIPLTTAVAAVLAASSGRRSQRSG